MFRLQALSIFWANSMPQRQVMQLFREFAILGMNKMRQLNLGRTLGL